MIRNKIDGQDVPMKMMHEAICYLGQDPLHYICRCQPPYPKLEIDNHQLRLEHQKCPVCPAALKGGRGPVGWFGCPCCNYAWRRRKDGYFDEQVPLDAESCEHRERTLA